MTGIDDFLKLFGSFTISDLVALILAVVFLILVYKKMKDSIVKKYEAEDTKSEQLAEALEAVRKLPEYRKQSIAIQQALENEILELRNAQADNTRRLVEMEEGIKTRERNKIRDSLLQNYRYYTSKGHNPLQAWTRMESEAFWELFRDYEAINGDGHIHTVVQPAMHNLTIIEMEDDSGVANLMQHRS